MCGIVGVVTADNQSNVATTVVHGLAKMEYRGYDSAGMAIANGDTIQCIKVVGKVKVLAESAKSSAIQGTCGIGHTRWATHGEPSVLNAHPIENDELYLIHNGIIDNYASLKQELQAKGYTFNTATDTEVIAALIADNFRQGMSEAEAVMAAAKSCHGAYAIAVMFRSAPQCIIGCRQGAPLLIGVGSGTIYLGSDPNMLAEFVEQVVDMEDGELVIATKEGYNLQDLNGVVVEHKLRRVTKQSATDKGMYQHYMLKEIHEQPTSLLRCFSQSYDHHTRTIFPQMPTINWKAVKKVRCIACGTSLYAAYTTKYLMEKLAKIPVEVEIASEFSYRSPVIENGDMFIFISQSGETADTLAALRYVREVAPGNQTLGVVNAIDSAIAQLVRFALPIHAGLEIGVASTKAFTGHLMVLLLLTLQAAQYKGIMDDLSVEKYISDLHNIHPQIEKVLKLEDRIAAIAPSLSKASKVLYIGRGVFYPIALEGALKMKELSYIPSEGVAAGELKHGSIALVDDTTFIIALAPYNDLFVKIASNIQEVKARKGNILLLSSEQGCDDLRSLCFGVVPIPESNDLTAILLYAIPLQLLAYHTALYKGHDVDQPRNLAKSVTVE